MDEQQTVERLSLGDFFRTVAHRWYLVLACLLAVPAIAYFVTSRQPSRYQATAKVLFRDSGRSPLSVGTPPPPGSDEPGGPRQSTILQLLNLRLVAERTAQTLGGWLTADQVAGHVSTATNEESDVYSVTAHAGSGALAARLANTYAEQFVAYRQSVDRNTIANTRKVLEERLKWTQDSNRTALLNRLGALRTAEALQDGYVEVAQEAAAPTSPVAPRPQRNAAIGGVVGLMLGIALALLFNTLDRRLRSVHSVETTFERPILGAIAQSRALSGGRTEPLPPGEREAFGMAYANLRFFDPGSRLTSVLVTSAGVGEGKSTVAWNLAAAAVDAGASVLLIEADLRRPQLARRLGASPELGLSDVLTRGVETTDAVDQVTLGNAEANGLRPSVDVIFGGSAVPNPADVIESRRMTVLLRGAAKRYNLVIVDAPPLALVPDAIPLIRHVSAVIFVARLGMTTHESIVHARAHLDNLGAPVAGVVVNGISSGDGFYGYAYQAARTYAPALDRSAEEAKEDEAEGEPSRAD